MFIVYYVSRDKPWNELNYEVWCKLHERITGGADGLRRERGLAQQASWRREKEMTREREMPGNQREK